MRKPAKAVTHVAPDPPGTAKVLVATSGSPVRYYVGVGSDLEPSPVRAMRFTRGASSTAHILITLAKVYPTEELRLVDVIVEPDNG